MNKQSARVDNKLSAFIRNFVNDWQNNVQGKRQGSNNLVSFALKTNTPC